MGNSNSVISDEVLNLELLANKSEESIEEIESLIQKLKSNRELCKLLGKDKVLNAINGLSLLTTAYNKLIDFAEMKISNSLSLKKCIIIRLFEIDNLILSFYENYLFFDNTKITKRINNIEKVINNHKLETFEFLDSSNDNIYH